ncbi:MAG: RNA polymerase sigma-70 factor [Bacteroidota bacterium]
MITDSKTDKELAVLIRDGDIAAFDKIYKKYSNRLYLFVFGIVKSQKDAEDIIQEVFIKVWDKRERINEHLSFQSFLFTISHNTTISLIRNKMKETDFVTHVKSIQSPVEKASSETEIEYKELKKQLESTLYQLPERQREVYSLSRDEELSYKEIAEKLGISVNTVENHMIKALKFVRENMKPTTYLSAIFWHLFIN